MFSAIFAQWLVWFDAVCASASHRVSNLVNARHGPLCSLSPAAKQTTDAPTVQKSIRAVHQRSREHNIEEAHKFAESLWKHGFPVVDLPSSFLPPATMHWSCSFKLRLCAGQ
mmetsp:Transcript_8096/g.12405  ORF Transcript_8096/g.12405 Transcript_8096/m.12405 type:complete len:112 (+) Transcript_8096:1476-1811(+)